MYAPMISPPVRAVQPWNRSPCCHPCYKYRRFGDRFRVFGAAQGHSRRCCYKPRLARHSLQPNFGLTENGPGQWSIDDALGRSRWARVGALVALAAGAAGSAAVLRAAKQEAEKDMEPPADEAESVTAAS